jgi:hypothetical protein
LFPQPFLTDIQRPRRAQQLGATMTFSVILLEKDQPKKIIGTIWANDQMQASALARDLCQSKEGQIAIRQCSEEREIPFRLEV